MSFTLRVSKWYQEMVGSRVCSRIGRCLYSPAVRKWLGGQTGLRPQLGRSLVVQT